MESEGLEILKDVEKLKTQINQLEERIYKLTYYDPLTQLPNHRKIKDNIQRDLDSAPEIEKALIVIDLDRFHTINELYGREMGNQVLVLLSQRLQALFNNGEMVYRELEEFAVYLEDITYEKLPALGEMIQAAMKKPFEMNEKVFHISASIGISHYPTTGKSYDTLIKQAEIATKKAKQEGRGIFRIFRAEDEKIVERTRLLEFGLDKAIENDEFYLAYQPKVILKSQEMYGVEALLRWKHPELGEVAPNDFITLAEETGHIVKIGYWVIEKAIQQVKKWHEQGLDLTIAVNISVLQFRDEQLIDRIMDLLNQYEVDSKYITLEITESTVKDVEQSQIANESFEKHNLNIAIDDFGTGYSSLGDLAQTSVQSIKVDRSFVSQINKNDRANGVVKTIINTGLSLGIHVLGEGIESKEQLEFLAANGCRYGQGYYFSKPVSAEEIVAYSKKQIQ